MTFRPENSFAIQYEPLSPPRQEIRVLKVAPETGDGMVRCSMEHISLLDEPTPAYETISYCWGLPKAPAFIEIDGHVVPVPVSSEAAIRRMRLCNTPRVLWIDAICINQTSLSERSEQVALMGKIYQLGDQNLIYLGEDTHGLAKRALDAIGKIMKEMRAATKDFTALYETVYDRTTGAHLFSKDGFAEDVDWEALEGLFRLQWFKRLWVLQEAVLSKSNVCYWGPVQLDLLANIRAARWITHKFRFISQGIYDSVGCRCAGEMFDFIDRENGSISKRHLAGLMVIPQRFEKTEPRDSIYAILGLLDNKLLLEDVELARLLEVDYAKTLGDVLRDATRYAACQNESLEALRRINHSSEDIIRFEEFSTWAVRADRLREPTDIPWMPVFFKACEGLKAPSLLNDISSGNDTLLGEGFIVDRILKSTTTCVGYDWDEYEGYHSWLQSAKALVRDSRLSARSSELEQTDYTAMAYALTAGEAYNRQRAQLQDMRVLAEYLRTLPYNDRDSSTGTSTSEDNVNAKDCCDISRMDEMYAVSRVTYCFHRRFFVTAAGRVGIGPGTMGPDDIVVVLRGGYMPFVMRRVRHDDYRLLGEAYVHGIMDGEAVEIELARGGEEIVFPIR